MLLRLGDFLDEETTVTSSTDNPTIAPPDAPSTNAADADDPQLPAEDVSQAIRDQLTLRINPHTHPSRLINQIGLADLRCAQSRSFSAVC